MILGGLLFLHFLTPPTCMSSHSMSVANNVAPAEALLNPNICPKNMEFYEVPTKE